MDSHRSASIILLDNDERIVELVTWFLRDRGYEVRTCASFTEARAAIAERAPELLVSDVDLGTESALVELPKLSGEGALPPTLVVSGFLDAHNQGTLRAVPEVMGTLAKPFEFTELEAAMERALAGERTPVVDGASAVESAPASPDEPKELEEDEDGWIEIHPGG